MTEQQHPITPPPELVEHWYQDGPEDERGLVEYAATQGARWGADQELGACYEWLVVDRWESIAGDLRAARRPNAPSLKEQALAALKHILNHSSTELGADTIRRALEQLDD